MAQHPPDDRVGDGEDADDQVPGVDHPRAAWPELGQHLPQRALEGPLAAAREGQVPLLLTGLIDSAMWFVGGVFVLIWLYLLQVRKDLLGSPFREPASGA